ncbi:MAG TPA: hypothetical protein VIJ25_13440, partial [Methylococcales bacterium]
KNANFVNCFGVGISIENSSNVMITMSNFKNLNGGVYALNSSSISVVANNFKNMFSTFRDSARGQFVQFNNVTGKGNIVQFNKGVNELGNSYPEDAVNLFQSSGTPTSPITINNNCFSGGGPSLSGGGIVTGDWGGANQVVKNNTLINVGQFGIGVAGGTKIKILNNSIYGARQVGFTNIGIYVWNQTSPPSCSDIQVERNRVDYTNSAGENNPYWNAGNCGTVTGESHNTFYGLDLSNLDCPF